MTYSDFEFFGKRLVWNGPHLDWPSMEQENALSDNQEDTMTTNGEPMNENAKTGEQLDPTVAVCPTHGHIGEFPNVPYMEFAFDDEVVTFCGKCLRDHLLSVIPQGIIRWVGTQS